MTTSAHFNFFHRIPPPHLPIPVRIHTAARFDAIMKKAEASEKARIEGKLTMDARNVAAAKDTR